MFHNPDLLREKHFELTPVTVKHATFSIFHRLIRARIAEFHTSKGRDGPPGRPSLNSFGSHYKDGLHKTGTIRFGPGERDRLGRCHRRLADAFFRKNSRTNWCAGRRV